MNKRSAAEFRVTGLVQGVGFRPFVHRLATRLGLSGSIRNDERGVLIRVEGSDRDLESFQAALSRNPPRAARVESIARTTIDVAARLGFKVETAEEAIEVAARIPVDLAVCAACLEEVNDPFDRRFGYPFTNCTDCGPRLTIIEAMPYDRPRTSMSNFGMCTECRREYGNPDDRRFHAQPIACAACGPEAIAIDPSGTILERGRAAIRYVADALRDGELAVLKGLGGFQLIARADRDESVARVRQIKSRSRKPLAVMMPDVESVARVASADSSELALLTSPSNPIVLVDRIPNDLLAPLVAPGLESIGLFLPTTPLHHLLLKDAGVPLIVTSANDGDSPTLFRDEEGLAFASRCADVLLTHDRPIVRRADDSVVRRIDGRAVMFRVARGFAPLSLPSIERRYEGLPPILAVGAGRKVAPALWNGKQATLGCHIGDLESIRADDDLTDSVSDLARLLGAEPTVVVRDAHDDYPTSRWADSTGHPSIHVSHHHAHAAAGMVENDLLDETVVALTWDGTGLGPDGTIWGGEILRTSLDRFVRVATLRCFPMPGGEAAVRDPRRLVTSLLIQARGEEAVISDRELLERLQLDSKFIELLAATARKRINAPLTSSMGRLFDAVAALLLEIEEVGYEGEAAVRLEAAAGRYADDRTLRIETRLARDGLLEGNAAGLLSDIWDRVKAGESVGVLAAAFHHAAARWGAEVACSIPGLPILLTGGCFQNRLLTESTSARIREMGRRVFGPGLVPPGDGGLAVGQLAIALERLLQRNKADK